MLEDHLKSPTNCRRLREGSVAAHAEAFVVWMQAQGYRPISVVHVCHGIASWIEWVDREAPGTDLVAALDAYKQALDEEGRLRSEKGCLNMAVSAGVLFLRFLREAGLVPGPESPPAAMDTWPVLP